MPYIFPVTFIIYQISFKNLDIQPLKIFLNGKIVWDKGVKAFAKITDFSNYVST